MWVTNTLRIMLEILNNYPWTRLSVRIIGLIKRQFFPMVTHVFDNSNLSQEIFAIDTWRAVICSLGHGRKHMLTIPPTIWRPGLKQVDDVDANESSFVHTVELFMVYDRLLTFAVCSISSVSRITCAAMWTWWIFTGCLIVTNMVACRTFINVIALFTVFSINFVCRKAGTTKTSHCIDTFLFTSMRWALALINIWKKRHEITLQITHV